MKRLIRTCSQDEFLGQIIEIIYLKSKYNGYRGWVGPKLINGKFRISLPPASYEETNKNHIFYILPEDIYKWVRIIKKNESVE